MNLSHSSGSKPVNLSLVPDVAIFKRTEKIEGFILSVWGENEQTAFALGLVNGSVGNSAGFSLGIGNYADSYSSAQLGIANWTKHNYLGFQGGVLNFCQGNMTGVQFGAVNYAKSFRGLQLAFVNYADSAENGVQIGLVNIIAETKKWFGEFPKAVAPVLIRANWRFK